MGTEKITQDPAKMSDAELIKAWNLVEGGPDLSPEEQAVLDEIERRNLDL